MCFLDTWNPQDLSMCSFLRQGVALILFKKKKKTTQKKHVAIGKRVSGERVMQSGLRRDMGRILLWTRPLTRTVSTAQHMCIRFLCSLAHTHIQTPSCMHTQYTLNKYMLGRCMHKYERAHTTCTLPSTQSVHWNKHAQRKAHFLPLHILASLCKPRQC